MGNPLPLVCEAEWLEMFPGEELIILYHTANLQSHYSRDMHDLLECNVISTYALRTSRNDKLRKHRAL
jgi:hypothetical protein